VSCIVWRNQCCGLEYLRTPANFFCTNFGVNVVVQCSDSVYCILCVRCGAVVFQVVTLFDKTGDLSCEIWVIFFNVALGNVFFVCALNDIVKGFNCFVYVSDWCPVMCVAVLFCFKSEIFPAGSFKVSVSYFGVCRWVVRCIHCDDDR
jgi:hypothetical protein